MKQIFSFLAVAIAVTMMGCDKETEGAITPTNHDGANVKIAFGSLTTSANDQTRAFGAGTTETWEKTISSATVIVFNTAGNIKFRRDLSATEIANAATTPISLVIPGVAVGDNCDFAVIANRPVATTVTTKTLLLAEEDSDAATYNGAFADVSTKAVRPSGFVMSGIATQAIAAGTTSVTITLKRVVAKVEIATATTQAFKDKYGAATVTPNKITLSRGASKSLLIDQTATKYSAGGATFTQVQNTSAGNNLFYIYEKATAAAGARVLLTIDATYDADGKPATTADQVPVTYAVELTGVAGGKILRNGAYKLIASIDGLTGHDIALTVKVADWETLVTENVNVGS